MNKSTFVLCAVLCAGLASVSSHAQAVKPTTHEIALAAAQREFKAEKYELATKDAAESLAVAASPDETGESLTLLGESYYRRKMYGEAQGQWAKMLALPDNDDASAHFFAHLGYARSFSAQGQWDKAIPEFQSVIASTKRQLKDESAAETQQILAPFTLALVSAYSANKQYDLAQEQLNRVMKYSEGDSLFLLLALAKKGEINMNQRNFKGALDSFNRFLKSAAAQGLTRDKTAGEMGVLIPLLQSLVKSGVGVGQANDGKPQVIVVPPPELAELLNTANQSLLDYVVAGLLTDSDEE